MAMAGPLHKTQEAPFAIIRERHLRARQGWVAISQAPITHIIAEGTGALQAPTDMSGNKNAGRKENGPRPKKRRVAGRVASQFSALAISQPALPSGDQDFDSNAGQPAGTSASSHETFKNENTSFGSKQILDLHKELEAAKKTGDDTQAIYDKYADISQKNREQSVAESSNVFSASAAFAEAEGGTTIANSLNRFPVFSSLTGEELSQLNRFVQAENEATASAIYQAMPNSVKVALSVKETVDTLGLGAAAGGKGIAALGVIAKNKQPYQPNQGAVGNMGEFFKQTGFGAKAKESSQKSSKIYQGQTVYVATKDINEYLPKGRQFYLDAKHSDHIEVFDKNNKVNCVLNLDGSINSTKTDKAIAEGRILPK